MRKYLLPGENPGDNRYIIIVLAALLLAVTIITIANVARILTRDEDGNDLREIRQQIDRIQCDVQGLRARYAERVTVTCYNSESRQTDSTPYTTAINTRVRPGTVAVSRDLLERGWTFGRKVWIEGLGVYTIEDVMHASKVAHLDIWQPKKAPRFKYDQVLAVVIK